MSLNQRKFLQLVFGNTGSLRAQDIPYDATDSIKAKIDSIVSGGGENISLPGQTIDAGLTVIGTPAFLDPTTGKWTKATSSTATPNGVFGGGTDIVLFGRVTGLSGLVAGRAQWMADAGGLTNNSANSTGKSKIGFAESATVLLVDIDVESSLISIATINTLVAGNYNFIIRSTTPSTGIRSLTAIGTPSTNIEGHFYSGSWALLGGDNENWYKITVDAAIVVQHLTTGGNSAVGQNISSGPERRVGQRFTLATAGKLDQIEITVNSLDLGGATNVICEIFSGSILGSGVLQMTSASQDLTSVGITTFTNFA